MTSFTNSASPTTGTVLVAHYRWKIPYRQIYRDNAFFINAILAQLLFNLVIGIGGAPQLKGIELMSAIVTMHILKDHRFPNWIVIIGVAYVVLKAYSLVCDMRGEQSAYDETYSAIANRQNDTIYLDTSKICIYPGMDYYIHTIIDAQQNRKDAGLETNIVYYPKSYQALKHLEPANRYIEYSPGYFMLIQDRAHPATFVVNRQFNILGVRFPYKPYTAVFDNDNLFSDSTYNIVYICKGLPLIENVSVDIIETE